MATAPQRLRVLLVITRGEPGGAQVHVRDLVRGLRERVAVEVCVGDEEYLTQVLRDEQIEVHHLPELGREVDLRRDARALRALRRLIRSRRPHLVHTHSTKAGLLGRLAARAEGRPAVHTAHAWAFSDWQPWTRVVAAVPPEVLVGRLTHRFVVVSQADGAIARRYRVARQDQLRVVHNGVSDTEHRARPGRAEPVVLTMVARLAAPKDHRLLLEALAQVPGSWELRLVGDGPQRGELEALAARLGLGERVSFLGQRLDVAELLADSQVGLLVSRQEGFPLVVLEAMRAGLPVIASDVGGIREAVEHEATGLLVARGDHSGLSAALTRLVADPLLRTRWGAAGRAAYEARFTVEQMVEETARVYDELCSELGLPPVGPSTSRTHQ